MWFRDGTIVVQAETTVFRVYQGILARTSSVFEDLFNIPQPQCGPTYDGVPLVVIEESAVKMTLLLKALHEWRFDVSTSDVPLSLKDAIVLARLSSKYCVDSLFATAIKTIKLVYGATNLDEYLSLSSRDEFKAADPGDHIAVVNLARKCNVPELLPLSFYRAAATLTTEQLVRGYHPVPPSSPTADHAADSDSDMDNGSGPTILERLTISFDDPLDAVTCAQGKTHLSISSNSASLFSIHPRQRTESGLTWTPCPACKDISPRNAALLRLILLAAAGGNTSPSILLLAQIQDLDLALIAGFDLLNDSFPPSLCEPCHASFTQWAVRTNQEMIWATVPRVFGLPAWPSAQGDS